MRYGYTARMICRYQMGTIYQLNRLLKMVVIISGLLRKIQFLQRGLQRHYYKLIAISLVWTTEYLAGGVQRETLRERSFGVDSGAHQSSVEFQRLWIIHISELTEPFDCLIGPGSTCQRPIQKAGITETQIYGFAGRPGIRVSLLPKLRVSVNTQSWCLSDGEVAIGDCIISKDESRLRKNKF